MNIPFEKFRDEACKHFAYEPGLFDRTCTYVFGNETDDEGIPCDEEICPFTKDERKKIGTYVMEYQCGNCGWVFDIYIPKGTVSWKNGGKCPNCSIENAPGSWPLK